MWFTSVAEEGWVRGDVAGPVVQAEVDEEDDEEGGDEGGEEEPEEAAEDEGGCCAEEGGVGVGFGGLGMRMGGGGTGMDESDGFEREGVAGYDEKDTDHGRAGEEEADEGEEGEVVVGLGGAVARGDDEGGVEEVCLLLITHFSYKAERERKKR